MYNKNINRKKATGIVYSTNPDFVYDLPENEEQITLPPDKQKLVIKTDSKNRKGKTVTLIQGFIGKKEDLRDLEKVLKGFCGTGGSSKDGEIIIQGEMKEKVLNCLLSIGYKARKI